MSDRPHTPVLIAPVLEALSPGPGGLMIDATFGAGGYSRALLERGASVVAFDRDPTVQRFADALTAEFGDRFRLVPGRYSEMGDVLPTLGIAACQGVVFDIGVSSMQLDEAERGFSFMRDGPLDMRMGRDGESAADIVNTYSPEDIARILWVYGEERASRRIAAVLVKRRAEARFERTLDLAETVEKALGGRRGAPVHPATRTFQALRIAVNDELGELERGLSAAEQLLAPGGRLAVVTFHSLEDRIAKTFLIERAGLTPAGSRHLPPGVAGPAPTFELLFRGAREASPQELADNPRARSAKLRAAVRTAAEPMGRREDVVDGRGAKRGRSGHSRSASRLLASPSPGLSRGSSSHPQIGGGLQLGPRDKPGEGEGKGFAFGSSRAGRPTVPEGQEVAR